MSAKAGREPNLALARIEQVVEAVLDFQFFHGENPCSTSSGFRHNRGRCLIKIICRKDFHNDLARLRSVRTSLRYALSDACL